jgi:hypothetical protein
VFGFAAWKIIGIVKCNSALLIRDYGFSNTMKSIGALIALSQSQEPSRIRGGKDSLNIMLEFSFAPDVLRSE